MANSELAVCSRAAEVGSLAFTATLGPLASTCGPLGVDPVNSPPVSEGLDSIHPGAPIAAACPGCGDELASKLQADPEGLPQALLPGRRDGNGP